MTMTREMLQQRFHAGFDRRLGEMLRLFELHDSEALSRQFHSLAGIGGTYGHPEVTDLARRGEALCEAGELGPALLVLDQLRRERASWVDAA
jgi:hypothetical protein